MFNLCNPSTGVPVDIIQECEALETTQSSHTLQQSSETLLSIAIPEASTVSDDAQSIEQITESSQRSSNADDPSDKQSTLVFSPEQNNMMKALGVVRKEPASRSKKRRRRILQLNEEDDSDDDNELKKQLLNDSFGKENENDCEKEADKSSPDSDDPSFADDPSAFKARSLLKSAVIILGPDSKKKKRRVLESDDEDEVQTSVDDIGLIEPNELENDEESLHSDIIISDAGFATAGNCEKVVSIENLIIPQDDFAIPIPVPPAPVKSEVEEKTADNEEIPSDEIPAIVEEEVKVVKQEDVKSIIKTEDGEIDPSMSVEAILENIKPMADDE